VKYSVFSLAMAAALLPVFAVAQQSPAEKVARTAKDHPDLSGIWAFGISLPTGGLKRVVNGSATVKDLRSERAQVQNPSRGCAALDTGALL
jgi:hypothetical protein